LKGLIGLGRDYFQWTNGLPKTKREDKLNWAYANPEDAKRPTAKALQRKRTRRRLKGLQKKTWKQKPTMKKNKESIFSPEKKGLL
jgi:phosphoribosyl 1,2-cyclic phosphodiesterase